MVGLDRKKSFRLGVSSLLALLSSCAVLQSATVTWDGSESTDWFTGLNWDNNTGPADGDVALIPSGTVEFADGTSAGLNALRLLGGTLIISGGTFKADNHPSWDSHVESMLIQTGGAVSINELEVGRTPGDSGRYRLDGGSCVISRGANGYSLYLGSNRTGANAGNGTFQITGGALRTRVGVKLGNATTTGTGTFTVWGSGATEIGIGTHSNLDGSWWQGSNSTLRVRIDDGGLTKIFVDDDDTPGGTFAHFEAGALLDVGYDTTGSGGGTWTVMEVENGVITNKGLAFAPGVNTNIWSFRIDNSGPNARLTVTAAGPPANEVQLYVGHEPRQQMKYGLDYERLWFWYGSSANKALVAKWSVVDCDVDYLRVAINCAYELEEGVYDLSAYTDKIIPMMTAMKAANPNIKFFGSPRPLNEAIPNARWQPYPRWITGDDGNSFHFNWQKCAQYLVRYVQLMKSYGFKIHYIDMSNEWNYVTPSDVRDIVGYMKSVLGDDMPLVIAPSTWSFTQGVNWLKGVDTAAKRAAIDIVSSHNTGRQGTPEDFVAAGRALGKEVWDTEVHGWKGTSPADEIPTFNEWLDRIRAGFSGLDSWLAIGTTAQKHCYILNNGSTVTRNVKYYIFRKLTTTSNYGYALDINRPTNFTSTAALVRSNLVTVWVLNNSSSKVPVALNITGWSMTTPIVTQTRWHEALPIEGVSDSLRAASSTQVRATIEANSLYCFELTVNANNVVPVAEDDYFFTLRNQPLTAYVLANDTDPDGQPLSVAGFTQGTHGTVTRSETNILTYTPPPNFTGTDRFTYTVTDGQGGISTADVFVGVYPAGTGLTWTNLPVSREAYIRGGAYADEDQDEVGGGALLVKYHASNPDFIRKAYFQFDLSGLFIPNNARAVFTVYFADPYKQNVQLWALNQPYPTFDAAITWNTAQANEPTGNGLLTNGVFTATPIGSVTNIPADTTTSQSFGLFNVRHFIHGDRLTLALTGAPETTGYPNDSQGLRLQLNRATLRILALPPAPPDLPRAPEITAIAVHPDGSVTLEAEGEPGVVYHLQSTPDLNEASWTNLSTNNATATGLVSFRDASVTNQTRRFYRIMRP